METLFRAALVDWLRADPALGMVNAVEEESPLTATPPWLGIAASASVDWSTKDRRGRETRVALELVTRGDDPAADAPIVRAIDCRVEALGTAPAAIEFVSVRFLRARAERRPDNLRAVLLEYRFRYFELDGDI